MDIGIWGYYLIVINIIGFILYIINFLLYKYTKEAQIDSLLTITSILFGSLGILVAILLFDRKCKKGNMMSRVFVICVFIIQLVIVLFLCGVHGEEFTLAFWDFFGKNKFLIAYIVVINFISFATFAVDKIRAVEDGWRIKIVTLLGLAFLGGSVGALLAMYILRHKIKKDYFTVGVPLIILMQMVVLVYVMNLGEF